MITKNYEDLKNNTSTSVLMSVEEMERYSSAIADALCWFEGFKAAGGEVIAIDIESLRDINIELKDARKFWENH